MEGGEAEPPDGGKIGVFWGYARPVCRNNLKTKMEIESRGERLESSEGRKEGKNEKQESKMGV